MISKPLQPIVSSTDDPPADDLPSWIAESLQTAFATTFRLYDTSTDAWLDGAAAWDVPPELLQIVAQQQQPQFVLDHHGLLLLALPLPLKDWLAVAPFLIADFDDGTREEVAAILRQSTGEFRTWTREQKRWDADSLSRLAGVVANQLELENRARRLEGEVESLTASLASTFEEISLLHNVSQNLKISSSDEALGTMILDWLSDCVAAEGLAIQLLPLKDEPHATCTSRDQATLLTTGNCPVTHEQFSRLVATVHTPGSRVSLLNRRITDQPGWEFPDIHQLVVVPLRMGDQDIGYLAAFNHRDDEEFGTEEASLIGSVAAMLGIHASNREYYRRQAELVATVVRALTSAIDAKDPYTCGHSDRVARISVRLAQQLGFDSDNLKSIYMAGLLHDIGKIGIDDSVLRKPGRLNAAELEHIKLHPELGYKILADMHQLAEVLPVVLHHHEQWDGGGYPHGLKGEAIPLAARVVAVADAFDAMSSDRPYRAGLPSARVDQIFREGAGQQWDQSVVDAFFAVRDEMREIAGREREELSLDVQQWT